MTDFVTTLEIINHCEKEFKLEIRESMNHIISMCTTANVDPFEFNKNLNLAIDYIEAQNPSYASCWMSHESKGIKSNAIVKFRKVQKFEIFLEGEIV